MCTLLTFFSLSIVQLLPGAHTEIWETVHNKPLKSSNANVQITNALLFIYWSVFHIVYGYYERHQKYNRFLTVPCIILFTTTDNFEWEQQYAKKLTQN